MKQLFLTLCLFFAALFCADAQSPFGAPQQGSEPKAPELEYVVCLHVTLDQAFSVGDTGKGKFEAPMDSKYAWMNESLFLCQSGMGPAGGINLDVWRVK